MLTPQEAEAHVFPKSSFGGYNMQQVDTFLDGLIGDYKTLYQENISLKNKMKILVDKIEEYRATEDAMRMTLHSAQKMAAEMVKEGEEKKNSAIREAVAEVQRQSEAARAILLREEDSIKVRIEETTKSLETELSRLEAAKASTAAYVVKLKELYTNEVNFIGSLSEMGPEEQGAREAAPADAAQPEAAPQPEEPVAARPESKLGDTQVFDQIQFNKDSGLE